MHSAETGASYRTLLLRHAAEELELSFLDLGVCPPALHSRSAPPRDSVCDMLSFTYFWAQGRFKEGSGGLLRLPSQDISRILPLELVPYLKGVGHWN